MSQYENVNGVWKESKKIYDNIGGVWKEVKDGYSNIEGIWREFYKLGTLASDLTLGQIVYVPRASGDLMKCIVAFKNYSGYPTNSISLIGLPDETTTVQNGNNTFNYLYVGETRWEYHTKIISNFNLLKASLISSCITTTVYATWGSKNTDISVTAKAFALNNSEIVALSNTVRYEIDIPETNYAVLLRDQKSIRVKEDGDWNTYSGFDIFRCLNETTYKISDVSGLTINQQTKIRYIFNIPNTLLFIERNGIFVLDI